MNCSIFKRMESSTRLSWHDMTHLFNLAKLLDYYHYHVYDYYAVAKKKNASRSEHEISVVSIRRQCKQVVIPLKTSVSLLCLLIALLNLYYYYSRPLEKRVTWFRSNIFFYPLCKIRKLSLRVIFFKPFSCIQFLWIFLRKYLFRAEFLKSLILSGFLITL